MCSDAGLPISGSAVELQNRYLSSLFDRSNMTFEEDLLKRSKGRVLEVSAPEASVASLAVPAKTNLGPSQADAAAHIEEVMKHVPRNPQVLTFKKGFVFKVLHRSRKFNGDQELV